MFDTVPSELDEIYWRFTLNDIKVKLRLYLGQQQASISQNYQTMAILVGQAFGSKKESVPENVVRPSTVEELQSAFGSVFG